jgi:glutamate synthase (NADPH) small chain
LGVDIPGFIRLLREDDTTAALERIRRENPFPAICSRICPAPCEPACIFHDEGSPIAVRSLERYASDFGKNKPKDKQAIISKGKKVAIIGSGPSGMTAAYYLAKEGYGVTIFEAFNEAGGLLRYGIPEFRLPQKVLDEQFQELASLGVLVVTNTLVGRTIAVQELFSQGFAAVLLAVGAGVPDFSKIPGHNAGGVYYAEEFLLRTQLAGKNTVINTSDHLMYGSQTAVIGSGPSALDAARMAIRLGQEVNLIFGGLEEELGVHTDDLAAAIEEGVKIMAPVEPLNIEVQEGFAKAVLGQKLEVVERDGKFILESMADGKISIDAQTVILSHGRRPNPFLSELLPQLKSNDNGSVWTDPQTGLTSVEKIFAAGNVATGAGAVVNAMASGKDIAKKIAEFLK